ncbi:MAG: hypothetical protein SFT81_00400 [Candidatus Caenarcaniphilales bacterium]|nr:hypothetical protein [Candidatus Caenarcaniphilales bacterium]
MTLNPLEAIRPRSKLFASQSTYLKADMKYFQMKNREKPFSLLGAKSQDFLSRLRDVLISQALKLHTLSIGFIASMMGDLISMAVLSNQLDHDPSLSDDQKNELRFQKGASFIGDLMIYWTLVKLASMSGWINNLAKFIVGNHSQAAQAQKIVADLIALLPVGILVNEILKTKFVAGLTSYLVGHEDNLPAWLLSLFRVKTSSTRPDSTAALIHHELAQGLHGNRNTATIIPT